MQCDGVTVRRLGRGGTEPEDSASFQADFPQGRNETVTTTTPGAAVDAKPFTGLKLGACVISEYPNETGQGHWSLTALTCDGKTLNAADGTAEVTLTSRSPRAHCAFTNTLTGPPTPTPTASSNVLVGGAGVAVVDRARAGGRRQPAALIV
jgi:hypothetical protein